MKTSSTKHTGQIYQTNHNSFQQNSFTEKTAVIKHIKCVHFAALFFKYTDRLWGPPSLLASGYRGAISPGVKQQGRKADNSPPYNAKVNNDGAIAPLPNTSSLHGD
jgi:hypothetical protein